MLELYRAYADYEDLMEMVEALLQGMSQAVLGNTNVQYQGETLDFSRRFARVTVEEAIIAFNAGFDAARIRDRGYLATRAQEAGVIVPGEAGAGTGAGKLQMEIFEKTCEDRLREPTFVTAYPTEVSPLSRRNNDDSFITDRFELFIAGREIANGFSELNDPEDQAERFRQQAASRKAGDDEAMVFDADYIRALEYGMPPTAGLGVGIDRLVMLFTDAPSIRDVLLFPHMRPEVVD
jgi:lysyl-tRNA synthetase class 2